MLYRKALDDYLAAHGLDGSAKPRRATVVEWLKANRPGHPYLHALQNHMPSDLTLRLPRQGMVELEKAVRRYCATNIPPIVPERWYSRDHQDPERHRRYLVMANDGDMFILKFRFPELQSVEQTTEKESAPDDGDPEPLRPTEHEPDQQTGWRRRLSSRLNGSDRDVVYTPEPFARRIIEHFKPSGFVLDPCRGQGAFYNNYPSSVGKDWCEVAQGRDFFKWAKHVDWILTNPPWSGRAMTAFMEHSMKIADNVAFLIPSAMGLSTRKRIRLAQQHGFGLKELVIYDWPDEWPRWAFTLTVHHWQRGWTGDIQFTNLMTDVRARIAA